MSGAASVTPSIQARRAVFNARVLSAEGSTTLFDRLTDVLPPERRDAALAAVDVAAVVVDAPGVAASAAVAALRQAGAFADIAHDRLVATGSRSAFAAAAAALTGPARTLINEIARAIDADRTLPNSLRLRDRNLDFARGAKVMGILNVTPDSFYDGNAYRGVDRARARAAEMVALGAAVLDIGGQSYGAGAPRVDEREERARVIPLIEALVRDDLGVPLSIDTWKSGVADAALAAGAHLINDCSGLADPKLASTVARYDAALVVMHLKGELNVRDPAGYRYDDALGEILDFLRERTEFALAAGIAPDALVIDPGLEFGKEPHTDFEILERFGDLRSLGYPILFAASRKSFLGRLFDRPAKELLVPSLATAAIGVAAGAALLRVHDIAESAQLVTTIDAVRRGWVDPNHGTEITRRDPSQRRA